MAPFVFSSLIIGDAVPISSVTKGDVFEVVKVNFAWKASDFVALRLVAKISSKFSLVPASLGFAQKGDVF